MGIINDMLISITSNVSSANPKARALGPQHLGHENCGVSICSAIHFRPFAHGVYQIECFDAWMALQLLDTSQAMNSESESKLVVLFFEACLYQSNAMR